MTEVRKAYRGVEKVQERVQCDPSRSHTFSSSAAVTWAVTASQRHYSLTRSPMHEIRLILE